MEIKYILDTTKSLKDKILEANRELEREGITQPHAVMFCSMELLNLLDDKITDENIPEASLHLLKEIATHRPNLIQKILQADNGKR